MASKRSTRQCATKVGSRGNAQTLHILTTVEKKEYATGPTETADLLEDDNDRRRGLNLTFRSLAAVLKYDRVIPERKSERENNEVVKGYYKSSENIVKIIKKAVTGHEDSNNFKTIECSIMDIADDIAYSTYDMEDCFKSGHLHPLQMANLDDHIFEKTASTINSRIKSYYGDHDFDNHQCCANEVIEIVVRIFSEIFEYGIHSEELIGLNQFEELIGLNQFSVNEKARNIAFQMYNQSIRAASNGYYRTKITSALVQRFILGVELIEHKDFPQLHNARLNIETFKEVESLKNVIFNYVIQSPEMQTIEFRGKDIVGQIFSALREDEINKLLPEDFRRLCSQVTGPRRDRLICDYVAGMTDRYAWSFYNRLKGTEPQSLFVPL